MTPGISNWNPFIWIQCSCLPSQIFLQVKLSKMSAPIVFITRSAVSRSIRDLK